MRTPTYTPPDREDALDRAASSDLDVLIIGGGITGVGIALDAVTRGYRVALVERDDLASGTSSKSSKLVHGGVRYLAQYDFGLVAEAVRERDLLRRIAPHLVRPLGFVVPVDDRKTHAEMKAGLLLYDGIAAFRNVDRHRRLAAFEVADTAPSLRPDLAGLGGYRYWDCQTDDARLVIAIADVARRAGALIVNHCTVERLRHVAGRIGGALVTDRLTGASAELRARWVVSATGVWAGESVRAADPSRHLAIEPSKGVHITLRARDLPVGDAVIVPSGEPDGRKVFVVPWGEQVYVGTTDEPHRGGLDDYGVDPTDAGYLLHAVNQAFDAHLSVTDVIGAWAGLRPLIRGDASRTADLSRRHAIVEGPRGFVTVTGGKLTTFRQMAEDVVDRLVARDGVKSPCMTHRLPLGTHGTAQEGIGRLRAVATTLDVDPDVAAPLFLRYGDSAADVLTFCLRTDGVDRLVPELPYLRGEVRWAVRRELARSVDDVMQRRLRVSLRHDAAGGPAIGFVADVLAEELGWSGEQRSTSIEAYLAEVARERGLVPLDRSWQGSEVEDLGEARPVVSRGPE